MRTRRRLLALVAALTLLAAACSDDDGSATGSSVSTPSAPSSAVSSATPTTPVPSNPGGGTLPVGSATTGPPSGSTGSSAPAATTVPTPDSLADVRVRLTEVATLEQPVEVVTRPGDATGIHVVDRIGLVVRVEGGRTATVLDMKDRTAAGGERGLLGATYSPDGGRLYVNYTDTNGDTVIDEYTMQDDGTADPDTRRQLLFQKQPYANHNGGEIVTGPDGLLYIGLGDGGSGGDPDRNGLDPETWLGKILRIDPTPSGDQAYTIPPDNPFATGGGLPEIFSWGLRNPWRFSFDPATGDLWIGDVGQNDLEEVDFVPAGDGAGRGVNFGWSAWEGTARYNQDQPASGARLPVHVYPHGDLGCSITGGGVYRGTAIPALEGAYLFSDYCAGGVRAIPAAAGPWTDAAVLTTDGRAISGFGRGPDGELYVVSLDGPVYRIDPA